MVENRTKIFGKKSKGVTVATMAIISLVGISGSFSSAEAATVYYNQGYNRGLYDGYYDWYYGYSYFPDYIACYDWTAYCQYTQGYVDGYYEGYYYY